MPSCAFTRCRNSSRTKNKVDGITFHTFPQEELWRQKWLKVVRKQRQEPEWLPTNNSRLCSIHFKSDDMYTTEKGYTKLSRQAVPYLQIAMEEDDDFFPEPASPNSLNEVDVSDLEYVFEPPRSDSLRRELEKETMRNRKLMRDNRKIKKKYKRLEYKCKNLKEIIAHLKERINILEDQFVDISCKAETADSN